MSTVLLLEVFITLVEMKKEMKKNLDIKRIQGADPEISERGGGRRPNSGKGGGQNATFQCRFQSFSYKSLRNIPPKGGTAARPAPPLNPRMVLKHLGMC